MSEAYYEQVDTHRFRPTGLTQGAWREDEQHMSVVGGLVAHLVEQHEPRPEMAVGRLGMEILGQIPIDDMDAEVVTLRPGRTIELVEVTLSVRERPVIRARAWRLATSDTADVAGLELEPVPQPQRCEPYDCAAEWSGAFLDTLEYRRAETGRDGRRRVWARTDVPLVAGVQVGPVARFATLLDLANGVATRVRPTELMFPNVELTVHLLRTPEPEWTGLDTSVSFGENGIGLTSTVLHDVRGPVGRAEQLLTLRRFPTGSGG